MTKRTCFVLYYSNRQPSSVISRLLRFAIDEISARHFSITHVTVDIGEKSNEYKTKRNLDAHVTTILKDWSGSISQFAIESITSRNVWDYDLYAGIRDVSTKHHRIYCYCKPIVKCEFVSEYSLLRKIDSFIRFGSGLITQMSSDDEPAGYFSEIFANTMSPDTERRLKDWIDSELDPLLVARDIYWGNILSAAQFYNPQQFQPAVEALKKADCQVGMLSEDRCFFTLTPQLISVPAERIKSVRQLLIKHGAAVAPLAGEPPLPKNRKFHWPAEINPDDSGKKTPQPTSDAKKRESLLEIIHTQPEAKQGHAIVTIDEFFDGNQDLGSIGCNLSDHPGLETFRRTLKAIEAREDVDEVWIEIYDTDEGDWPFAENVLVAGSIKKGILKKLAAPIEPTEIITRTIEQPSHRESKLKGSVHNLWWD